MHSLNKKLRKIVRFLRDLFVGWGIEANLIIVRFDGGFSSQIAFWALARHFQAQGHRVKLDLTWFREDGKDMFGDHVRNFDLPKAFPCFEYEEATDAEVYRYKKRYALAEQDFRRDSKPPAYLGAYYDRWPFFLEQAKFFSDSFKPLEELDTPSENYLNQIKEAEYACGVHVRRGDLAVYNPVYGDPIPPEYFERAVSHVLEMRPDASFFFFSDDMDWTQHNVLPLIGEGVRSVMIKGNDSSKGYVDLYLMKHCSAFITSQGSFAKFARALAGESTVIVEPDGVYWAAIGEDPNRHTIKLESVSDAYHHADEKQTTT